MKSANAFLSFSVATGIIDVGCNPRTTFDPLLQNYGSQIPPTARIIAADLSPGIIEQIQKRKQKEVSFGNEARDRIETSVSMLLISRNFQMARSVIFSLTSPFSYSLIRVRE